MSNIINLKRGLDIPISGVAAQITGKRIVPDIVAVKPTDFKGFAPRLLVREGDKVLAGSPVLADKQRPSILVTSPVSGVVTEIVRGEKRKLLEVRIKADKEQKAVDFGGKGVGSMTAEEVKDLLLKSGLWVAFIQRPYGIVADPEASPKAIFISAFSTAPLAADTDFTLKDDLAAVQTAVEALAKLTKGGVHFSIRGETSSSSPFHKVENVIQHVIRGKHPAGNVGIQIANISPIKKGETVWTVSLLMLAAIGRLLNTGKLDLSRKVAVTGPLAKDPCYVDAFPGMPMSAIADKVDTENGAVRYISGDALTGTNVGENGSLGFFDDQVTLLHEGTERELLGWAKPFRTSQFSSSKAYFSWLFPRKKYAMDTNMHGGLRAFVVSDVYSKVLPVDIFPIYLIKACLAGDIDKMEKFGIYELLPEDLALCEFVDPSKNDIQSILQDGINLMIKEMA